MIAELETQREENRILFDRVMSIANPGALAAMYSAQAIGREDDPAFPPDEAKERLHSLYMG